MNNRVKSFPEYLKCPQDVKRRIESIFSFTLEHCPYPESINDRICWIHSMDKTLRGIEYESLALSQLTK